VINSLELKIYLLKVTVKANISITIEKINLIKTGIQCFTKKNLPSTLPNILG
jgi:hypothetical protein